MLDVSDVVGQLGWYHLAVGAITVLRAFPTSWTLLIAPFIVPDVDHWCAKPAWLATNWTDEQWKEIAIPMTGVAVGANSSVASPPGAPRFERCRHRAVFENDTVDPETLVACDAWTYNETVPGSSAVPEWDLVCSHDWQRSLMQSVVFAGSLVGALALGRLSDMYGRRFIFFVSNFGFILFASVSAASPSATCYNSLRFITAICVAGIQTTAASLFTEIVEPRHRNLLNVGFSLGFTLPTLLLPGVAYLVGSWKYLQLTAGLSGLILIPFIFILQESPRWLVSTHREKQARAAILKILRINGRQVPDMETTMRELVEKSKADAQLSSTSPVEILRHRRLLRNAILLFIVWFCDNLLLFATTLSSVDLGGSRFINFALSAAGEIPGGLVSLPLVRYCRRRRSQAALLLLAGLAAILISLLPLENLWLRLGLNMTSRFLLVISGAIKWVFTMELFPTATRSFGFAACFTMGRIGGMVAPFMRDLGIHVHTIAPTIVLSGAGLCGATAACFLPETLGKPLPDTFDEANNLGLRPKRKSRLRGDVDSSGTVPPGK
ncbi:solute carrier family 22 member 6-A [Rhipicephalus sanguineus]|uniref:solute carrier family 22 member 6-A n=1 Tax=Rhipicephalus sanguineus TaxID=34632 RepID=UPI001894DA59|nr:solute carrier family 22 member 6-A [Rhipicephalus sanguineus]XP_037515626.1 solute carrier family 22 member 6-A [Rhipicephalus sanguineus]